MEEKIGTCPYIFLASKKGARQTKLTTALWYWQHCYWHQHVDLNPLLVPTDNCNSTFLLRGTTPRDVTWQNFRHGKIISRKNSSSSEKSSHEKRKKSSFCEASTFHLLMETFFWMFVVRKPLPPQVAWLPTSLALTCIDKRQFFFPIMTGYWAHFCKFSIGYIFWPPKISSAKLDCFRNPISFRNPKRIFIGLI